MPYRIELGPEGSPNRTLTDSDLLAVDVQKPHTALADFEAEIPYERAVEDHAMERVRVYAGDTPLFQGYLKEFDWTQRGGVVRLNGPGIGDDLRGSAIERTWTSTAVHKAIEQVWNQDTAFDATVRSPEVSVIREAEPVVDASSGGDLEAILDLSDTDPVVVDGNSIRQAQSAFLYEPTFGTGVRGATHFSGPVEFESDGEKMATAGYFGGTFGDAGDDMQFYFDLDYDIPDGHAKAAFRYTPYDRNDDGDLWGLPGLEVKIDGTVTDSFAHPWGSYGPGEPKWFTLGGADGGLEAGRHNMEIEQSADSDDTFDEVAIDLMVVYDDRFEYNFDNNAKLSDDESQIYLDGPEKYPGTWRQRFIQQETGFNVVKIVMETDGWGELVGETGGTLNQSSGFTLGGSTGATTGEILGTSTQGVAVSPDGGDTWFENRNGTDVTADIPGNIGRTIDFRITLDRWGSDQQKTPNYGFRGQRVGSISVTYDASDLSIIQDDTLRGSPFKILQDLHKRSGYRFAVDHAATDGQGDLTKRVESFQRGTVTKTPDWSVQNRNPKRSFSDYANRVTIYGELKDDGTRPKVQVQDDGEVSDWVLEPYFEIRPDLKTVDQVRAEALDVLNQKVKERERKGTLDVFPSDILPGYSYPVDWFEDGDLTASPMESVSFNESHNGISGTLKFAFQTDVAGRVIEQGRAIDVTRRGV